VLHFAFVASLAVVYVRREPWALHFGLEGSFMGNPFSPDGKYLVVSDDDEGLFIHDAARGDRISIIKWERPSVSDELAQVDPLLETGPVDFFGMGGFSPDGRTLLMERAGYAELYDVRTGKALATLEHSEQCGGRTSVPVTAFFAAEGALIVTSHRGETGGSTVTWDARSLSPVLRLDEETYHSCLSPEGGRIVTRDRERKTHLRDVRSGRELAGLGHVASDLLTPSFSPDGLDVLISTEGTFVHRRDAKTGKDLGSLKGNWAYFTGRAHLAILHDGKTDRVVDVRTGNTVMALPGALRMIPSPDGATAVCVVAYDLSELFEDGPSGELFEDEPWELEFSIRDLATGEELWPIYGFSAASPEKALAYPPFYFSPDGAMMAFESLTREYPDLTILKRRHPERWWGHLYRPEMWAAVAFGLLWLWSVARWAWGRPRPV
jgi:hypothetical protein